MVAYLGMMVESEMNEVDGKTPEETKRKRQLVLDGYFSVTPEKITKGLFADPALLFGSSFTVTE